MLFSVGVAQTEYSDCLRDDIAKLTPGSKRYLLAKFKLTDALRVHDLRRALANSNEALDMAEKLGDDDWITVAKLQRTVVEGLLYGRKRAESELKATEYLLSSDATPELRVLLGLAIVDLELWSYNIDARLDYTLESLRSDVQQCRDPHLVARQQANDLYTRLFCLGEDPDDPNVVQVSQKVQKAAEKYPMLESKIVLALLKSREYASSRKRKKQQEANEEARDHAKRLGHQFYLSKTCDLLAFHKRRSKDLDGAVAEFERGLGVALRMEAQAMIYHAYRKLANVERERGNSIKVTDYLTLAGKSPAFEDISFLKQNSFFQNMASALRNLGKYDEARRLEVVPFEVARRLRAHQNRLWEQADAEQARMRADHATRERASAERIAQLRTYLIVSLTIGVIALLTVCLWAIRKRLRHVTEQLSSEKENVRQSNQERDDLALRLHRMQRMESLGLMAGSVAHDFNNILVGVLGNAEILQLKQDSNDPEFVRQRISRIITSAEKAAGLSHQMLAYAGRQQIARKSMDLNQLIDQYQSVLRSSCLPDQHLEIDLMDEDVVSKIDTTQVEQVVLNLVTNAVHASKENGKITIETGFETIDRIQDDPSLYGNRVTGGRFSFVEVRDDGQGISADDLERIFEPFYTKSDAGRGLGLSVVYGVVRGHDGLIRCRSVIGKGTSFRVLFPVSIERPADQDPSVKESSRAVEGSVNAAQGRTVLVVDDEESVIDMCKQLLEINGWNVLTAIGGRNGLAMAEDHSDQVDCMLVDVVMPEMGANELLQHLEDRQLNIPVVLMSGFSQTKLEFFAERPNVASIVQKPFHASDIQDAVLAAAIPVQASRSSRQKNAA